MASNNPSNDQRKISQNINAVAESNINAVAQFKKDIGTCAEEKKACCDLRDEDTLGVLHAAVQSWQRLSFDDVPLRDAMSLAAYSMLIDHQEELRADAQRYLDLMRQKRGC